MLVHKPFNIVMLVTGTQCRQHDEEAARRTWLEAVVERYSRQVRIRPEPATGKRHIFKGNQVLEEGSASQVQPGACVEICRDATLILQVLA